MGSVNMWTVCCAILVACLLVVAQGASLEAASEGGLNNILNELKGRAMSGRMRSVLSIYLLSLLANHMTSSTEFYSKSNNHRCWSVEFRWGVGGKNGQKFLASLHQKILEQPFLPIFPFLADFYWTWWNVPTAKNTVLTHTVDQRSIRIQNTVEPCTGLAM